LPDELQPPDRTPEAPDLPEIGKDGQPYINRSPKPGSNLDRQRAFKNGVQTGAALANSSRKAINSAQSQDTKQKLITPVLIQTGETIPPTTPVTGITGQTTIIPNIVITPPNIPNAPPSKVDNCPSIKPPDPDPEAKCKYDNLDIAGKCENIINKLEVDYSLAWNLPECEQDFTVIRSGNNSGQGLNGIAKQIDSIYETIKVLHDKIRCIGDGDKDLAIPENWNIKRSIEIDQMVIVTKKLDDTTSYRRSFSVPHPRHKTMKSAARIKRFAYKRGSAQATINLRDNSSCVLNCSTIAEAKRVVRYILQLIQPTWAKDARVNYTEKINMYIQPTTVELHKAQYFSSTDNRILPDWSINLR
jgi:hypothetical protein